MIAHTGGLGGGVELVVIDRDSTLQALLPCSKEIATRSRNNSFCSLQNIRLYLGLDLERQC